MSMEILKVIGDLERQREVIDKAIAALRALDGAVEGPAAPARPKRALVTRHAGRKVKVAKASPKSKGTASTRDLVFEILKSGPKRAGAVVKALRGKVNDQAVYAMLNYLKAKGELRKNEDATYEIAKGA